MNFDEMLAWGYWLNVMRFLGSVLLGVAAVSGIFFLIGKGMVAANDWLGLYVLLRNKRR